MTLCCRIKFSKCTPDTAVAGRGFLQPAEKRESFAYSDSGSSRIRAERLPRVGLRMMPTIGRKRTANVYLFLKPPFSCFGKLRFVFSVELSNK